MASSRNGEEVWGATRSPQDSWYEVGRYVGESIFEGTGTPRDGLTSGRGLLDEAAGDVPARLS